MEKTISEQDTGARCIICGLPIRWGLKHNCFTHKCYVASNADEDYEYVCAIVAESASQAKTIGMSCLECDYISVRVKKHGKVDVSHLPIGEIKDYLWALSKGLYGWIEDVCPRCKQEGRVQFDGGYFCDNCEDEYNAKSN